MPAEFQKAIDRTLNHAKNIFCLLDDILIVSKREKKDHKTLVINVLKKLDDENLALKLAKCQFFQTENNSLGHKLTPSGITPKFTKTEAILNLQHPKLLKPLRLGSFNHVSKFVPNAASWSDQFRPLLREENEKKKTKNVKLPVRKFEWREKHSLIFEEIKKAVAQIAQINYYDPLKDTRVKCDASNSALGASLEQKTNEDE